MRFSKQQRKMELLAPAGSFESFFAALENGADAVFCGLKSFSARAKAKNFSMEEMGLLSAYAHSSGKKIYVALNTLIQEAELNGLVDELVGLSQMQIDGLIIQDFGLYHLAHTHFPEIPLHASTQMTIHNVAGVHMLERMGFTRVVLARELSLEEIAVIGSKSTIELEHFIHGALCYSISGHCLFSSSMDGRSGNRGRCVQPCRRRYSYQKQPGFYFSTSDFSAIDLIPQLAEAGVMSCKIEGRMKSAEYVAAVVSAYRMVLDAPHASQQETIAEAKKVLEKAMGRKSTQGFLPGKGQDDIVLAKQKGGIGRILGRVERLQGKNVVFKTDDVIHVGDRIRIQPGNDRAGQGFTVRTLFLGKRSVKRAGKGSVVSLPFPFRGKARSGDMVFKLATGKTFTMSEEACRKRLARVSSNTTAVQVTIQCGDGTFHVTALANGVTVHREYQVDMLTADRSPLTAETLAGVFRSTGNSGFFLHELHADHLPPVVIKPSRLKEIRRDFYTHLLEIVQQEQKRVLRARLQAVKKDIEPVSKGAISPTKNTLYLVTDCPDDLIWAAEREELQFIVPLNQQFLTASTNVLQWSKGEWQRRLVWDLPSVVFDEEWQVLQKMMDVAQDTGFTRFRLNNPAHLDFFRNLQGVQLSAGPWLYTLNSQAIKAMQGLGVRQFYLSLEDDRENIAALLAGAEQENLFLTVYSPIDLFTSRIPASFRDKSCSLQNDQGDVFWITEEHGLTVTRAREAFSLLGGIGQLRILGCCNFVIDLRGVGCLSKLGQEVVQAFYKDLMLPETNSFNFNRGLA